MDPLLNDNALKGKIARLPGKIRDQISQRMFDGQPGRVILPWLNALPEVGEIVFEGFQGVAVSDQNLTTWRATGYQDWCRRHERIERTKELASYAATLSKARGASIADGAAAIASGKLLELLEEVDDASGRKLGCEDLVNVAGALASLRTTEQNDVRLRQNDKRLGQNDRRIDLVEQQMRTDQAKIALKVLGDDRAKSIEAGAGTNAEKIEAMGQHLFGELWKQPEVKA